MEDSEGGRHAGGEGMRKEKKRGCQWKEKEERLELLDSQGLSRRSPNLNSSLFEQGSTGAVELLGY